MAAAPANNIAATFAGVPTSSSSLNKAAAFDSPTKRISTSTTTSWNPHVTLPQSYKSSLLNIYGRPGPSPLRLQSSAALHSHDRQIIKHQPLSVVIGQKLPAVTFSYLDPSNKLRTLKLSSLCSRAKRVVVIGAMAAFAPSCTQYVKKSVETMKSTADLFACVGVNNVYVIRAWGEFMSFDNSNRLMMLSDERGELLSALGLQSKRFCFSASNGVITSIDFEDDDCGGANNSGPSSFLSPNGLAF